MEHLPLALMVVVGAGLALVGLVRGYQRSQRQRAIPAAARAAGLDYSPEDPFNCTAVAFPLFRAGDGRTVQDVMWRRPAADRIGGDDDATDPVRVFDYSYYDEYHDRSGAVRKEWHRFTCALVRHNGSWPQLHVTREGLLDKAEHLIGGADIDFESEEFNRTFAVRCGDRRFASAFIDPQMMEILLKTGGTIGLDTMGRYLLLSTDPLDAEVMPRLLAMAEDVLAHVPPAVWELYPTVPDEPGHEDVPLAGDGLAPARPAAWLPFDETPSLLDADEAWDPTPGVDHDLDGHVVEPTPEDPWHDRPAR